MHTSQYRDVIAISMLYLGGSHISLSFLDLCSSELSGFFQPFQLGQWAFNFSLSVCFYMNMKSLPSEKGEWLATEFLEKRKLTQSSQTGRQPICWPWSWSPSLPYPPNEQFYTSILYAMTFPGGILLSLRWPYTRLIITQISVMVDNNTPCVHGESLSLAPHFPWTLLIPPQPDFLVCSTEKAKIIRCIQ